MRIHRSEIISFSIEKVVNCFQNTNFSEDSQVKRLLRKGILVVNCFQNTNFSEDSQESKVCAVSVACCELLSEY